MRGGEHAEYEVVACLDSGKVSWGGLRVAGLCIGVDAYKHIPDLGNAVRDAEAVNTTLRKVPGCYSMVLRNPSTRAGLIKSIARLVQEPDLLNQPPDLFFFYYAGHGISHKRRLYLVPGDANVENAYDLVSCVPLDDVMHVLATHLDVKVSRNLCAAVTFVFVLDSCRVSLPHSRDVHVDLEPEMPSSAPRKYKIIFSCARTRPASDGQRGGHSPFAQAVLDAEHGFFAEGITLHSAIPKVCSALESMNQDQRMVTHGTADAIPLDFCIQPKPVSSVNSLHTAEVGMASQGDCNELTAFLIENEFLPAVASRISNFLQVSVAHFLTMQEQDLHVEELSFLNPIHKRTLLLLVNSTAHNISLRDSSVTASRAPTPRQDVDDETSDSKGHLSHSIVGGYHEGHRDVIQAHLKMFLHEFMDENPLEKAQRNFSLCTILWMSFLWEAEYQQSKVKTFESWIDNLLDGTEGHNEDGFVRTS